MRLLFHIAWRSLVRARLASFLLVLAVTVGTAFQIPNTANLEGYTAELVKKGLATGHLVVTHPDGHPIEDTAGTIARLRQLPFVTGIAARVEHAALLVLRRSEGEVMSPVPLVGVDMAAEASVTGFCGRIERGACLGPGPTIVLGKGVAERTRLVPGQRVRMLVPWYDVGEVELTSQRYEVSGVLAPGGGFPTDREVFIDVGLLHKLLEVEGATHLFVYTDDLERAAAYAAEASLALPRLKVEPWTTARPFVANSIAAARTLIHISAAMVTLAVIVPVLALLFIQVLHERRQTATLAAIGFGRRQLFIIALIKAALVGFVGAALGTILGLAACELFVHNPIFDSDGFVILPVVSPSTVLVPVALVFLTVLVGGLWPALQAARSNPSSVLRE